MSPSSPQPPLRLVFAGTPEFAATHLRALVERGPHQVVAVYCQPDRQAGRGKKLQAPPVKLEARRHALPVLQPASLKAPDVRAELAAHRADLMVVVAYGLILPQPVLDIFPRGCINVHASLLPRWRGAAPIERAIEAGDSETGVTIMQMDAGLDTGDMLHNAACPIAGDETGDSLRAKLAPIGADALIQTLDQIRGGTVRREPQDNSYATYAAKLQKEEAFIDWRQPAIVLDRRIRAFNSANVMHTLLHGERIRIWETQPAVGNAAPGSVIAATKSGLVVGCGEGALTIKKLQLPGGKVLDIAAVLNGRPGLFAPGLTLGD